MSRRIDLTGNTYGRLQVIGRNSKKDTSGSRSYWDCVCECGNTVIVHRANLTSGRTQSCGCLHREIAVTSGTKHKGFGTRLYRIWTNMHTRCTNPKNKNYARYGGRGIQVCSNWSNFEPFRDWAMSNGYDESLTLDRKDNNGNYCPENCQWTTQKRQANNTRKTLLIEWNGEAKPLSDWSEQLGIPRQALRKRIRNRKWSVEKAFTTPLKNNGYSKIKEDK